MKLSKQSANVSRTFSEIRYGGVGLPPIEFGIRPSSLGGGSHGNCCCYGPEGKKCIVCLGQCQCHPGGEPWCF
jgi:hypothetical protein